MSFPLICYTVYRLRSEGLLMASNVKYEDGKEWIHFEADAFTQDRWECVSQQDDRIRDIFSGMIKDIFIYYRNR